MPGIMVGMDQYDNYVGDEAQSQVSTVRPEQDEKLLMQTRRGGPTLRRPTRPEQDTKLLLWLYVLLVNALSEEQVRRWRPTRPEQDDKLLTYPGSVAGTIDVTECVDLSGCVNDVQISALQYVSDQDEFHATVVKSFVRVEATLAGSSCSSVGFPTCTGSGDLPCAAPMGYTACGASRCSQSMRFGVWDPQENPGRRPKDRASGLGCVIRMKTPGNRPKNRYRATSRDCNCLELSPTMSFPQRNIIIIISHLAQILIPIGCRKT